MRCGPRPERRFVRAWGLPPDCSFCSLPARDGPFAQGCRDVEFRVKRSYISRDPFQDLPHAHPARPPGGTQVLGAISIYAESEKAGAGNKLGASASVTDARDEASPVAVLSHAIRSATSDACGPPGTGPCEHKCCNWNPCLRGLN